MRIEESTGLGRVAKMMHRLRRLFAKLEISFHKLSLLDSLRSTPIHFTTIENVMLEIAVDEVIN
jgi:hypothetical protein